MFVLEGVSLWVTNEVSNTNKHLRIDHFHYDVTRAKVSGSCSKDRAQCRAIARKCQKITSDAMSAKASYWVIHKVMCLCSRLFKEIQRGDFSFLFFFSMNEELRRVFLRNISKENFFSNSEYRVCSRKTCL